MDNFFNSLTHDSLAWMKFINPDVETVGLTSIGVMLLISLVSSFFISSLYLYFYGNNTTGSQIHRAFPMLGLSITGIFISIQFSLPLSLGLLGALSIIRFRTPIKEPEEVGFIMLVISTSLGIATFNIGFLCVFLVVAVLGLVVLKYIHFFRSSSVDGGVLLVSMSEEQYRNSFKMIHQIISESNAQINLKSLTIEDPATATYDLKKTNKLNQLELTESILAIDPAVKVSIFINYSRITAY